MPRIRSRISATIYIENQEVKRQPPVLFIMLVLR